MRLVYFFCKTMLEILNKIEPYLLSPWDKYGVRLSPEELKEVEEKTKKGGVD